MRIKKRPLHSKSAGACMYLEAKTQVPPARSTETHIFFCAVLVQQQRVNLIRIKRSNPRPQPATTGCTPSFSFSIFLLVFNASPSSYKIRRRFAVSRNQPVPPSVRGARISYWCHGSDQHVPPRVDCRLTTLARQTLLASRFSLPRSRL